MERLEHKIFAFLDDLYEEYRGDESIDAEFMITQVAYEYLDGDVDKAHEYYWNWAGRD